MIYSNRRMEFDLMDKFLNKVHDERMRGELKKRGVRKGSYLISNQKVRRDSIDV
jgi:hypothetical protein